MGLSANPFRFNPRADILEEMTVSRTTRLPIHCGMLAVLHFDPVLLPTATIWSIAMLYFFHGRLLFPVVFQLADYKWMICRKDFPIFSRFKNKLEASVKKANSRA
jgi:hypothetical protein